MALLFEIHKTYTFNTLAPSVLGVTIKNAKLLSILDYDTALQYENVELKYRQVFPLLPNGTVDDAKSTVYYLFLAENGEKVIIAESWVDELNITLIEHINLLVSLPNVSLNDITSIRDVLNSMGYTGYEITQV